jgi:hypothetical protein
MKKVIILIGLAYFIVINCGCPKPCIEANYSFAVNSQIIPDKDSVHVGDTIFLSSSFSDKLLDQSSGIVIDYSDAVDIGSAVSVIKLNIGDTVATDAVFDFNYLSINGKVYNDRSIPRPDGVQQLTYQEAGGKLYFEGRINTKTKRYLWPWISRWIE